MLQKKKIRIKDFFDSPQEALKKISKISAQDIISQLESRGWRTDDSLKEMVNQGTAPVFENFRNFNFDSHSSIYQTRELRSLKRNTEFNKGKKNE